MAGFLVGVAATALLAWRLPALTRSLEQPPAPPTAEEVRREVPITPSRPSTPPPVATSASNSSTSEPLIGTNPSAELRGRHLQMPIRSVTREDLHDSFEETRGTTRRHEAIDILAPRNTPVLAVEDGTIARLFLSKAGGITVYQFDPTATYAYYYAHLERYADGLREGDPVKAGQVLGSVGTSGNADRNTPHLHFAIFRLTDKKRWWEGTAIDPYEVLKTP